MKIAVISDIHGNLLALRAVLADVEQAGVDLIVNLGDLLSGPLWPVETARLLMSLGLPTICGNHERQLLSFDRKEMGVSDQYTDDKLEQHHRDWMAGLPETLQLSKDVFLCHGTPDSDLVYLLADISNAGVIDADDSLIRERLVGCIAPVVLCGHTHVQRQVVLDNGQLIVNPGSVGLPAFNGSRPVPYKMEAGSPHARYAVISGEDGGAWSAKLRAVKYDWESAAVRAEQNGHPNWATALRTGFA